MWTRESLLRLSSNRHCRRKCKLWHSHCEKHHGEIKSTTTVWSSNHTCEDTSKVNKISILRRHLHPQIYCNIIMYDSQDMKTNWVSREEWTKKTQHRYTMEYYSVIRGDPAICNSMDGPWEHDAKWDDLPFMWNLKKPNSEKQQIGWWSRGWGGGGEMDEGTQEYKVPVLRRTSGGNLLYSMVTRVHDTVLHPWKLLR